MVLPLAVAIGGALLTRVAINQLTPRQKVEEGKSSLDGQGDSQFGAHLRRGWGEFVAPGERIFMRYIDDSESWGIREKKKVKRSGGFLTPKVKQIKYIYDGYWADLFCFGPIARFERFWFNGKSEKDYSEHIRTYLGTASQPVDPLVEVSIDNILRGNINALEEQEGGDRLALYRQTLETLYSLPAGTAIAPAFRHRAYAVFDDFPLKDTGNSLPEVKAHVVVHEGGCPLSTIFRDLAIESGWDAADIEAQDVDSIIVPGYFTTDNKPPREHFSLLGDLFGVTWQTDGNRLIVRPQPTSIAPIRIPLAALAARDPEQERPVDAWKLTRIPESDRDFFSEVRVEFQDKNFDFQDGAAYDRRADAISPNVETVSASIALDGETGKAIARRRLDRNWTEEQFEPLDLTLPPDWGDLEKFDIIVLNLRGRDRLFQIERVEVGANGLVRLQCRMYDPEVYSSQDVEIAQAIATGFADILVAAPNATFGLSIDNLQSFEGLVDPATGTAYTEGTDYSVDLETGEVTILANSTIPPGTQLVAWYSGSKQPLPTDPSNQSQSAQGDTILAIADCPPAFDENSNGLYVAATGGRYWDEARLYVSYDGETSYEEIGDLVTRGTFGSVAGDAAIAPANTLQVQLQPYSPALSSATASELVNGANRAVVGDRSLVQFETATLVGEVWQLSGLTLISGDGNVSDGDRFLLLEGTPGEPAYIERLPIAGSYIGSTLYFKATTEGQSLDDVSAVSITFVGHPFICGFSPATGVEGDTLTIVGEGLTGAMDAAIGGVSLSGLTVVSDGEVTGAIAPGTTGGKVSVSTPGGTGKSATAWGIAAGGGGTEEIVTVDSSRPTTNQDKGKCLVTSGSEQIDLIVNADSLDISSGFDFTVVRGGSGLVFLQFSQPVKVSGQSGSVIQIVGQHGAIAVKFNANAGEWLAVGDTTEVSLSSLTTGTPGDLIAGDGSIVSIGSGLRLLGGVLVSISPLNPVFVDTDITFSPDDNGKTFYVSGNILATLPDASSMGGNPIQIAICTFTNASVQYVASGSAMIESLGTTQGSLIGVHLTYLPSVFSKLSTDIYYLVGGF